MKPKLLSPRGYLSYTQIDMFERSPERYIRQYILGEKEFVNNRMDFGSRVAYAEETGEQSDDEMINMLVALLPKYPIHEHEIRVAMQTDHGEITLLGKLDKFDDKTLAFRDTKTGTKKWTQNRADRHSQLDHYATMIWLKHGKMPHAIHLDWAETEIQEDGSVCLTGGIQTFEVKKTLADILKYMARASKVAREIDAVYRREIQKAA